MQGARRGECCSCRGHLSLTCSSTTASAQSQVIANAIHESEHMHWKNQDASLFIAHTEVNSSFLVVGAPHLDLTLEMTPIKVAVPMPQSHIPWMQVLKPAGISHVVLLSAAGIPQEVGAKK